MKIKSGIYKIQHLASRKLYIGSSADIPHRFGTHRHLLRNNKHHSVLLQNAFNKYGENAFEFSIVVACDVNNLVFYEQLIMDHYRSYKKEKGYNICVNAESCRGTTMGKKVHKLGDRFGRLVLIQQVAIASKRWLCQCDCGKQKTLIVNSLKCGYAKSCGCYNSEVLRMRNKRRDEQKGFARHMLFGEKVTKREAARRLHIDRAAFVWRVKKYGETYQEAIDHIAKRKRIAA